MTLLELHNASRAALLTYDSESLVAVRNRAGDLGLAETLIFSKKNGEIILDTDDDLLYYIPGTGRYSANPRDDEYELVTTPTTE